MGSRDIPKSGWVIPARTRTFRTALTVLAAGVAVAFAIGVLNVSLGDRTTDAESVSLSRAQQAEADRLTGLAESMTLAGELRRREAETARWEGLADRYQRERARQAESDRLTGLAEHVGEGLSRAQRAEADRLTGLAESMGLASP